VRAEVFSAAAGSVHAIHTHSTCISKRRMYMCVISTPTHKKAIHITVRLRCAVLRRFASRREIWLRSSAKRVDCGNEKTGDDGQRRFFLRFSRRFGASRTLSCTHDALIMGHEKWAFARRQLERMHKRTDFAIHKLLYINWSGART
jgi:hypothetical protein